MTLKELIDSISPETLIQLKRAVEIGKWPDGASLTREQRELSLQAVIAWEQQHLPVEDRSGFIEAACKSGDVNSDINRDAEAINIRWLQ